MLTMSGGRGAVKVFQGTASDPQMGCRRGTLTKYENRGDVMGQTPGERAILGQLRELYANTSKREHSLATITGQWLPPVYDAYQGVLTGLVGKGLLQAARKGQAITITDAGLKAMGVPIPIAASSTQTIKLPVHAPKPQPEAGKRSHGKAVSGKTAKLKRPAHKSGLNLVRGFGTLAAVSAGWLIWRFVL